MKTIVTSILAILVLIVGVIVPRVVIDTMAQSSGGEINSESDGPELWVNDEKPWVSKVFAAQNVTPGDSGAASIKVENKGETGNLTLHLLSLVDESFNTTEPESLVDPLELSKLSQYLDILIWLDDGDALYEPPGEGTIAEDTLYNVVCNNYTLGILPPGITMHIGIAWSLDISVGNEIHNDRSTFDIQIAIY